MKNQNRLQFIGAALIAMMLMTQAKAQELAISLKVNSTYVGCCGDTVHIGCSPNHHSNFHIETNPIDPISLGWSFKVKRWEVTITQGGDYKLWDLPEYGRYTFFTYYNGVQQGQPSYFYVKP